MKTNITTFSSWKNNMKLIYITNARIPTEKAHGIQIMEACSVFAKEGLEVELIVPRRFNWIKKDPFEYYGKERNFKIKKLPCLDLIILDKYIGHLGLWIESFTFLLFAFFYMIFQKADIIYTRDKFFLSFSLIKNNIIFEAHTFPRKYYLYSFFFKRVRGIVAITQNLGNFFTMRDKGNKGKIIVLPDGVDLAEFDIKKTQEKNSNRKKLGLPLEKNIVLYSGHLYAWKGVSVLLEVAKSFSDLDYVQFVFIGGTEKDVEEFKQKARGLSNVTIVGHKPHSEIPYWLSAADVLVLPNSGKEDISKLWTSPMKMFEYMASGRPIVASDLPSLREVLNENNSVLVEPDNPEKLDEAIKKILENPQLAEKISDQAFKEVQDYTWEKRAKKIFEFLSSKNS